MKQNSCLCWFNSNVFIFNIGNNNKSSLKMKTLKMSAVKDIASLTSKCLRALSLQDNTTFIHQQT